MNPSRKGSSGIAPRENVTNEETAATFGDGFLRVQAELLDHVHERCLLGIAMDVPAARAAVSLLMPMWANMNASSRSSA